MKDLFKEAFRYASKKGIKDTLSLAWNITTGFADYYLHPRSLRTSRLPPLDPQRIRSEMKSAGLYEQDYDIDVPAFREWLKKTNFPAYYMKIYKSYFVEKALEHFVGADLMGIHKGTLVDVASSNSPWFSMVPAIYGVHAIAMDMKPPSAPIQGNKVAADAARMPFADCSVNYLSLHCAFETFEGGTDTRFIAEACRVLRDHGKMVILPLYLHQLYHVYSSPGTDRRGVDYQDAPRIWHDQHEGKFKMAGVRFCRFYNASALCDRVEKHRAKMKMTVFNVKNAMDVDKNCYLRFIALFEKGQTMEPIRHTPPGPS